MADAERYKDLKKLPVVPAARLLASGRAKISEKLPMDMLPPAALQMLEEKGKLLDLLRLFAHALPRREATWWGCLAGRDILPKDEEWRTLTTAEAWVFKPGEAAREAVFKAVTEAGPDEETSLCAHAALHALPNEHGEESGPPGATAMLVEAIVMKSLFAPKEPAAQEARAKLIIDRAFDIAKGGNGRIEEEGATGTGGGDDLNTTLVLPKRPRQTGLGRES